MVPYSRRVHLKFSLLLEDISDPTEDGHAVVLDWELEKAFDRVFGPFVVALSSVHEISFSSEVAYHAPLTVVPFLAEGGGGGWAVEVDEVKAFVNSDEWTVGGTTGGGAGEEGEGEMVEVELMVFVPKKSRSPLRFELPGSSAPPTPPLPYPLPTPSPSPHLCEARA